MTRLLVSVLSMMFYPALVVAQAPQVVQTGFTVERELGGADRHRFEVNLRKGQLLNLVVEQRGVDVVLRVYAPGGKLYDQVDSPNGREGNEQVKLVSLDGGRYRIEIKSWSEAAPAGKYFLKTVAIRPATATELTATRLRDELVKIVAENGQQLNHLDTLKRFYTNRALLTNSYGQVFKAATLIEELTKNPIQPPAGASSEIELGEVYVEDLGDVALLSVRQRQHIRDPKAKLDLAFIQRIGYVFQRVGGQWRIASVQRTYIERERKPAKLDARQLDALVGVYDGGIAAEILTITREGNELFGKYPEEEKFELIPETESILYGRNLSFLFLRDGDGTVTQVVIHYPPPEDKIVNQSRVN